MASEKFLRLHLKVMQIGRQGWVVVPQLAVGVHDLCPPLQKQRIPAYYPVHHNASEKIQFSIPQKQTLLHHPWRVPNQTFFLFFYTLIHVQLDTTSFTAYKQQILYQYFYHMAANFHQMVALRVKSTHVCCRLAQLAGRPQKLT